MRRIMYHHNIVKRNESELVHKVYMAQKRKPMKYEWIKMLEKDFELIGEVLEDSKIKSMNKKKYKKYIKERIIKAAFESLNQKKLNHSKVQNIIFNELKPQTYITYLSNDEIKLLFRLRTRTTEVKCNFKTKFKENLLCILGCSEEDTQEHLLQCKYIIENLIDTQQERKNIKYEDLFNDKKQQAAVKLFSKLFDIRTDLISSPLF